MTYLDDMRATLTEALEPLGVHVTLDPSAAVPPCLLVDSTPERILQSVCGVVRSWEATLLPPPSTDWLAAQWLAEHLDQVRDAIDEHAGAVVEEKRAGVRPDQSGPPLPAYVLTFHAT